MSTKTIKLFATLREFVGLKELTVPFENECTVRDLLRQVAEVHPELGAKILDDRGELSGLVHILVQGRNIVWLEGLDTPVRHDQDLAMVPPVGGG